MMFYEPILEEALHHAKSRIHFHRYDPDLRQSKHKKLTLNFWGALGEMHVADFLDLPQSAINDRSAVHDLHVCGHVIEVKTSVYPNAEYAIVPYWQVNIGKPYEILVGAKASKFFDPEPKENEWSLLAVTFQGWCDRDRWDVCSEPNPVGNKQGRAIHEACLYDMKDLKGFIHAAT